MVVGMIVRIRNEASHTFQLKFERDPFYTPRVAGQTCGAEVLDVPPGFDETAEDLVVPWAATSRSGLTIEDLSSGALVRCVIGPHDGLVEMDWLRLHDDTWAPLADERWLVLGKRHVLGMMGDVVELRLTFRVPFDVSKSSSAKALAERCFFERDVICAEPNTVFLNVFDLASAASIPNAMLCNSLVKTFGAFHAAVEVYGEEWSFYRQIDPSECGVARSVNPRQHPVHVYRQSVNLGTTLLEDYEVWNLIRSQILPQWPSRRYNLIHCNCIHFCDELVKLLGVKPVPPWVRGLHETGAAILPLFDWRRSLFGGATEASSSSNNTGLGHSRDVAAERCDGPPSIDEGTADWISPTDEASPTAPMPSRPDFLPALDTHNAQVGVATLTLEERMSVPAWRAEDSLGSIDPDELASPRSSDSFLSLNPEEESPSSMKKHSTSAAQEDTCNEGIFAAVASAVGWKTQ